MKKSCLVCKKEIIKTKYCYGKRWKKRKFCSNKCNNVFQDKKVKKLCLICKKEFKIHLFRVKSGDGLYCSRKCHGLSLIGKTPWNKNKKGLQPWHNISGLIKKGTHISYEHKKKISMYLQGITKEKDWKGFVYSETKKERKKFANEIRRLVIERDKNTCQECGSHEFLQVDHIMPWVKYPEFRFDMNNCITLCVKCHYKKTYGKEFSNNLKGWGHIFLQ